MPTENPVRETTFNVAKRAKNVKIRKRIINNLAAEWSKKKSRIPPWPKDLHFSAHYDEEAMVDYLIILDSLNFCFWHPKKERWRILYNGIIYDGYFALSLALKEFFEAYPDKANLRYFANIPFSRFLDILQGGRKLLLLKKRWEVIRRVSQYLVKYYNGDSRKFVLSGNHKFSILIPKIANELFSFSDTALYNGQKVYLWKRAQILAVDIHGALGRRNAGFMSIGQRGIGSFEDPEYPTAFPDYRLPQVLQHLGILEYSTELEKKIKNITRITPQSEEEIEIRSATIWAVEYLRDALRAYGKELYSFEIDWLLWNKSRDETMKLPHHRTKTYFY